MTHNENLPSVNLPSLPNPPQEVVYDLKLNNLSEVELQKVFEALINVKVFPSGALITRNAETMEILQQVPVIAGASVQYIEILDEVIL